MIKNIDIDMILDKAFEVINPKTAVETVSIFDALDRVIAQDVYSQKALPPFDNSKMDGYAINSDDLGKVVTVIGTIFAGSELENELKSGESFKIMTGAVLPKGADVVVPFEDILESSSNFITLPKAIKNRYIRYKNSELEVNKLIINSGVRLASSHLALLASQGVFVIKVFKKVKIGIFSSGNEIKEPWEITNSYQIYNSNSMVIYQILKERCYDVSYIGSLKDDKELIKAELESAFREYDCIITTGGVSKGEADFIKTILPQIGVIEIFDKIDVRPGKPTTFGIKDDKLFFALPGNPLSSLMNLSLFGLAILEKFQGAINYYPTFVNAKSSKSFKIIGDRANIILGNLINGEFIVCRDNMYESGMILPFVESDSFLVIKKGVDFINCGDIVKVIPYKLKFIDKYVDFINSH